MRRRLYYMLPNVKTARAELDELLLARIEERHIHGMHQRDIPGNSKYFSDEGVIGRSVKR